LDLVMPNLDGVGVLRSSKERADAPRFVVVSMAGEESDLGIEALELGAFDVVTKPTGLATDELYDVADELRKTVLAAGNRTRAPVAPLSAPPFHASPAFAVKTSLVVIGASTGGPQALTQILRGLPADFPVPIAIVLHMPEGYTEAFARRVDADAKLDVMEARHGLELVAGRAVVARAGMHLVVEAGNPLRCALELTPTTTHRPSVDVLFRSAAEVVKEGVLGVVLTGMGNDGLEGARAIDAAGGRVLTESEASCVVYGMPRVVVEAGLSHASISLRSMAESILQRL
ncbi:MAG TPA: chemotaxis protein CheB, partial [Polyangiaceae bacterium]